MTLTAIFALIKDLVIVAAIGLLVYVLVTYGKDIVKVADLQGLQKQLTQNSKTEADWRKELTDANTKRDVDLSKVTFAIDSQRAPVYIVRGGSANPGQVPGHSPEADRKAAGAGGADAGRGGDSQPVVDVRPQVNAFELKYETVVADCRAALDSWPISKTP